MAEPHRRVTILSGGREFELRYPADAHLEAAVVGAMIGNRRLRERLAYIAPDHMTSPGAAAVVAALRRAPMADAASLRAWLEHDAAVAAEGGAETVGACREAAAGIDGEQLLEYGQRVHDFALRRAAMAEAERLLREAADIRAECVASEVVSGYARSLERLAGTASGLDEMPWNDAVAELGDRLSTAREVWPSRFRCLNDSWGDGLEPGRVYAFKARPKSAKTLTLTTLGFQIAQDHDLPVAYFLHEMRRDQITARVLAAQLGMNERTLKSRRPDEIAEMIVGYLRSAPQVPFRLINAPGMTFDRLRAAATEVVVRHGARVVCIDYWQLIDGRSPGQNKNEHLEDVAKWMHDFANSRNVVVLTAEQQNREGHSLHGDGLARNADWVAQINKVEGYIDPNRGACEAMWLNVEYPRIGPGGPIGTREMPALAVDGIGPMLREV